MLYYSGWAAGFVNASVVGHRREKAPPEGGAFVSYRKTRPNQDVGTRSTNQTMPGVDSAFCGLPATPAGK
jgi:hypothetical protein